MLSSNTDLATDSSYELPSNTRAIANARRSLEQVVSRLEHRANAFEHERDTRCVFARAYARVTRRLADSLPNAGFADPEWVAQLEQHMAEAYFRALGDNEPRSMRHSSWPTVLEAEEQHKTTVQEALVLGVTTHFVQDLPLALCAVGMTARNGQSRLADYHALNDVLSPAIEDSAREVASRYEHWFDGSDRLSPEHAGMLTNQGVRIARATAWYNAQRLLDTDLQANARAAIRRWTQITLADMLRPRVLSAHMVTRGARLVSRWTRRWPQPRVAHR